jgi:hypothetical protein
MGDVIVFQGREFSRHAVIVPLFRCFDMARLWTSLWKFGVLLCIFPLICMGSSSISCHSRAEKLTENLPFYY